jgi:hypothetical protein
MNTTTAYHTMQDGLIHSTTEYARLTLNPLNRPLDPEHLERLYDAISKRNLLREYPILVDKAGVILDGQHRYTVAKELSVPIYYIVATDATIEDVPEANGNTKHWTARDWLYAWIQRGNQEYVRLRDFWEANNWMTLTMARDLCHYGDRQGLTRDYVKGRYTCNDLEFANAVARSCLDFKRYYPDFYRESTFVSAVAMLHEHEGYSHKVMMDRLQYQSARLTKQSSIDDYLAVIEPIYNYRSRAEVKMHFVKLTSNDGRRRKDRRNRLAKTTNQAA